MQNTNQLIRLLATVPPMLEAAFQYQGNADLVAFHWIPYSENICICDSLGGCGTGANWNVWFLFIHHPAISLFLAPFDLGGCEDEAKHWLLLDRKQRVFYVGAAEQVKKRLSENPPSLPEEPDIGGAVFNSIVDSQLENIRQAVDRWDAERPGERKWREQQSVQELQSWLGAFWQKMSVRSGANGVKKP